MCSNRYQKCLNKYQSIQLTINMQKSYILIVLLALCSITLADDKGQQRLNKLRQRSQSSSNRIIEFSKQDFNYFAMTYPRPYDLVIYFTAGSCRLCEDLWPEYQYTANLYRKANIIDAQKNPTFFITMKYSNDLQQIFKTFSFTSAPNLVVSKPYMAVVSQLEKKQYLQKFKWAISYSDGHVTSHKMLEFINKRTERDVIYTPTTTAMLTTLVVFLTVVTVGIYLFVTFKNLWTNWLLWLIGSLLVYITCVSGVIYDIIHDVPFVGRHRETGEVMVFADGNRQQYGAEGLVISLMIALIGILFISIIVMSQKMNQQNSLIGGVICLAIIYWLVGQLEDIYKAKSWYGPSFHPPGGYLTGPISRDQGNNI